MDKITKIKYYIDSLCIYDLKNDPVIKAVYELINSIDTEAVLEKKSTLYKLVSKNKSLKHYISTLILHDDNIFSRSCCAKNEILDPSIIQAVENDLEKLEVIADFLPGDIIKYSENDDICQVLKTIPDWQTGSPAEPFEMKNWKSSLDKLKKYYEINGYGIFAKNRAFTWRDEKICPVLSIDPIRLTDLKNYESQRQKVIDNTESFLLNHPANNVLLYGDRGTGKSSTVHAILNEYWTQGLRMIEIPKSAVAQLTLIREAIADSPLKFIIYIDDLSFDSNDNSFSELKAALEGSLSGKQENILIYATSNRRHLIKENFSDRENDVNRGDTMQEQLSLSDRFGLSITFLNPDKFEYLDIVKKLAMDRGLTDIDQERLCLVAEQWATKRAGRSPRCAKQCIDYIESCHRRGKNW